MIKPNARRIAPPIRINSAEVSPTLPATFPKKRALYNSPRLSVVAKLSLSGVAVVTPSAMNEATGSIHLVRAPANEILANARPASAGLKIFCPKPPNISLATAMQKIDPIATIHNGVRGGITSTNRIAVIIALPSM